MYMYIVYGTVIQPLLLMEDEECMSLSPLRERPHSNGNSDRGILSVCLCDRRRRSEVSRDGHSKRTQTQSAETIIYKTSTAPPPPLPSVYHICTIQCSIIHVVGIYYVGTKL